MPAPHQTAAVLPPDGLRDRQPTGLWQHRAVHYLLSGRLGGNDVKSLTRTRPVHASGLRYLTTSVTTVTLLETDDTDVDRGLRPILAIVYRVMVMVMVMGQNRWCQRTLIGLQGRMRASIIKIMYII